MRSWTSKHEKLVAWLRENKLSGVLIRRNENVAWLTGGAVELRVLTPCETGVASLLVTAEGKRYYFTTENEAPRLHDEEFGALDFEPVLFPWYADDTTAAAQKLAGGPLGSDTPLAGTVAVNLYPLRASLSETEIARYRWLGTQTAAATIESLHEVEPGLSEYDLEALTAANLLRRGILPSVYLFAVDDRIYKYKHAVARGARLKKYGMLNLCSRKWGLAISITRFVHFGELPAELGRAIQVRCAGQCCACSMPRASAQPLRNCSAWRRLLMQPKDSPAKSASITRADQPATASASGLPRPKAKRPSSTTRPLHGIRASAAARPKIR